MVLVRTSGLLLRFTSERSFFSKVAGDHTKNTGIAWKPRIIQKSERISKANVDRDSISQAVEHTPSPGRTHT